MPQNRLAAETSPYLLQHADNPVDWYPWGEDALAAAVERDVPILLSVGYAACHWCHVMAHESFEDAPTAATMNEYFVNIKVDREERPDIDGIYMDAVQAMTGHGGWPMTVFLTPGQQPFFAGTYFPPTPHHGAPSFSQVLNGVHQAWMEQRDDLTAQAQQVIDHLRSRSFADDDLPDGSALGAAVDGWAASSDATWGGSVGAPKFPQPMTIDLLLRMHVRGDERALPMATTTLDRMARGGIFDHVGGGFHRYSVDGRWHVPHFEKMLYDNAQLVTAYMRAWLVTRSPGYRDAAINTIDFMLRELQLPDGGFSSSLDADTDGTEGVFYTWSWSELLDLTSEAVATYLGATPEGNWEGTNVLWKPSDVAAVADRFGMTPEALQSATDDACARLLEVRADRTRPGIDDKMLASWNGLAIAALAEVGTVFGYPEATGAAIHAATSVRDNLVVEGRLMRSWRAGTVGGPGFLDDHACLAEGLLQLYQATGDETWFVEARALCDAIIDLFVDPDEPGLFQVGADADQPIFRPKDLIDSATPSGNSAAALVLQHVASLTGDTRYTSVSQRALLGVASPIRHHPTGFAQALCALDAATGDPIELVIVGAPDDPGRHALEREAWSHYSPNRVIAIHDPEEPTTVPLLEGRPQVDGKATAYVCRGWACQLPVTTPADLAEQLEDPPQSGPS